MVDNNHSDEKIDEPNDIDSLAKEKILLELMKFGYVNEQNRGFALDNKASSLIAFLGVMLTLQATIFTPTILEYLDLEYIEFAIFFFLASLVFYIVSILFFINSYRLKKFLSAPNPNKLIKYGYDNEIDEEFIAIEVTGNLKNCIANNMDVFDEKCSSMNAGFIFLIIGIIFSVIFIYALLWIV